MTHDPLCPKYIYDMPCCCNLIARVRSDERMKAASRVMSIRYGASLSVAAAAAAGDVDAGVGL